MKKTAFFEKLSLQISLESCSRVGETVKRTQQDFYSAWSHVFVREDSVFQSFGERMNMYGTVPQCVVSRTNSDVNFLKVCKFFLPKLCT